MAKRLFVFVGSYAEADGPGVYLYAFDEDNQEFNRLDEVTGLKNPTFLNVDPAGLKLYSIHEGVSQDGGKTGEIISFQIEPEQGKLQELNRVAALNNSTCHIQREAEHQVLVVSSYHGGTVGLVALMEDGLVGEVLDVVQHEGSGPHPNQDKPHPHSAFFSPDKRFILVSDLGIDRVRVYELELDNKKLRLHQEVAAAPGAGPRHLVFHPNGGYVYGINELNSTVSVYRYDALSGSLETIESVSTLPEGFTGDNACAEITISQDGRFVYGSNRGHDSIVVYEVDQNTGKLQLVQHISTEGKHPRHFALTPSGKHLIVANRDTNNLVLFQVDSSSGRLVFTGKTVEISKPVCVQPVYV